MNRCRLIIDAAGQPTLPLLKLLELLNISHDGTLASIVNACQSKWCQPGKERWEFVELYQDKKTSAYPLLQKLGCIHPFNARDVHYDCALLFGGHASRMDNRIQFLNEQWRRGIRFKKLIFLTGARPLDPRTENTKPHFSTETEMIHFLFNKSDAPKDLRELPRTTIDTPMQQSLRPNTSDTIREWLKLHPKSCKCLAVSCQPFIGYHDACLRALLPKKFLIETIGPKADKTLFFSIFLYNIERWIEQAHRHSL
jgi:hypothetical protein